MPNYSFEGFDTSEFKRAIRFAFENTQKSLPDIVNRASLVAIIGGRGVLGAMQRTPKASASAIRDVDEGIIAAVVRRKHRGQKLSRADMRRLIKKEYARRIAAIGYTANVGWNNAAIAFGGRGIGRRATGKGYAEFGQGIPATQTASGIIEASFSNSTPAATKIGQQPLQDALNDTARDIIQHIEQKMGIEFDRASAK